MDPALAPRATHVSTIGVAREVKIGKVLRLGMHWQVVVAMVAGVTIGAVVLRTDAEPRLEGVRLVAVEGGGVAVESADTALVRGKIAVADRVVSVDGQAVDSVAGVGAVLARVSPGKIVELRLARDGDELRALTKVEMSPDSPRASWIAPFDFVARLFLRLLQMLIVPLIVTSMVAGVLSIGDARSLGRLGLKTGVYYVVTSLLAILVGLAVVSAIGPGRGAELPLTERVSADRFAIDENPFGILLRSIPENVFESMSENGLILQVIVFSLLFGIFTLRAGGETASVLTRAFQAGFAVMMSMAEFVLRLVPVGVLALIARVVGLSGFDVFADLLLLMATVVLAIAIHAFITLPLILVVIGRVNPLRWARAVWPALVMGFSTSSSSITLPVTMRSVEERGRASNRVSSFVLPLGATVNMDGTALYECVGVIFLAQYYASTGEFELTFGVQLIVVFTSLLASIGAAGIPSAGLVMMTTILSALGLPLEGTFLLLAIDRPLDMLRTATNIWSDTTCVAFVARSEGETAIAGAGGAPSASSADGSA